MHQFPSRQRHVAEPPALDGDLPCAFVRDTLAQQRESALVPIDRCHRPAPLKQRQRVGTMPAASSASTAAGSLVVLTAPAMLSWLSRRLR